MRLSRRNSASNGRPRSAALLHAANLSVDKCVLSILDSRVAATRKSVRGGAFLGTSHQHVDRRPAGKINLCLAASSHNGAAWM